VCVANICGRPIASIIIVIIIKLCILSCMLIDVLLGNYSSKLLAESSEVTVTQESRVLAVHVYRSVMSLAIWTTQRWS